MDFYIGSHVARIRQNPNTSLEALINTSTKISAHAGTQKCTGVHFKHIIGIEVQHSALHVSALYAGLIIKLLSFTKLRMNQLSFAQWVLYRLTAGWKTLMA